MTQSAQLTTVSNPDVPTTQQKKRLAYYWPLLISLAVIALDQWSKRAVEQNLGPLGSGKQIELLGGFFRIIYIVNRGASFGFLNHADVSWVFGLLALVASIGILIWYVWVGTRVPAYQLGMGLALGGIIGNLLDRIFNDGGVTDILNFPNIELFKVFNVADSGITIGITIIIIMIILQTFIGQKPVAAGGDQRSEIRDQKAETAEEIPVADTGVEIGEKETSSEV